MPTKYIYKKDAKAVEAFVTSTPPWECTTPNRAYYKLLGPERTDEDQRVPLPTTVDLDSAEALFLAFDLDDLGYEPDEEALREVPLPPGTGISVSKSGQGIHVFMQLDKPIKVKNMVAQTAALRKSLFEFYQKHLGHLGKMPDANNFAWLCVVDVGRVVRKPEGLFPSDEVFMFIRARERGAPLGDLSVQQLRYLHKKKFPNAGIDWDQLEYDWRPGRRYWDNLGADADSVVVRRDGVTVYTGEHAFIPWNKLFSPAEIKEARRACGGSGDEGGEGEDEGGESPEDLAERFTDTVFYVGDKFWWKVPDLELSLVWKNKDATLARLEAVYDLSTKDAKAVMKIIQAEATETGTCDMAYKPLGPLAEDPRIVVKETCRALTPAEECSPVWGEDFPFLGDLLEQQLGEEQLKHFLGWLAWFYQGALELKPRRGPALILVGGKDSGKTFLANCIIGGLGGGFAAAETWFTGEDMFNGNTFAKGVLTLNDVVITDPRKKPWEVVASKIKAVTANDQIHTRSMFAEGKTVVWLGRAVLTLNDDAMSMRMLPPASRDITDKVSYMKVARTTWAEQWPAESVWKKELPKLARWLLDHWKPAEGLVKSSRWGFTAYHHPELLSTATHQNQGDKRTTMIAVLRALRDKHPDRAYHGRVEVTSVDLFEDCYKFCDKRTTTKWDGSHVEWVMTSIWEAKTHGGGEEYAPWLLDRIEKGNSGEKFWVIDLTLL